MTEEEFIRTHKLDEIGLGTPYKRPAWRVTKRGVRTEGFVDGLDDKGEPLF